MHVRVKRATNFSDDFKRDIATFYSHHHLLPTTSSNLLAPSLQSTLERASRLCKMRILFVTHVHIGRYNVRAYLFQFRAAENIYIDSISTENIFLYIYGLCSSKIRAAPRASNPPKWRGVDRGYLAGTGRAGRSKKSTDTHRQSFRSTHPKKQKCSNFTKKVFSKKFTFNGVGNSRLF